MREVVPQFPVSCPAISSEARPGVQVGSGHALWNGGGGPEPTAWLGLSSAQQATQARFPEPPPLRGLPPACSWVQELQDIWLLGCVGGAMYGQNEGGKRAEKEERNAEGCGQRDTETHVKARQKEQSWCRPDPPHRGQVCWSLAPLPSFPFLPHPLSVEEAGRPSQRERLGAQEN